MTPSASTIRDTFGSTPNGLHASLALLADAGHMLSDACCRRGAACDEAARHFGPARRLGSRDYAYGLPSSGLFPGHLTFSMSPGFQVLLIAGSVGP
jgi:hypothetical protein